MKPKTQPTLFPLPLPANVVLVKTADLNLTTESGIEVCVRRMFAVPFDKSMLLDFLVGRKRGDPHASEEHAELHRLMALLNSRFRGKRFNFLGDSFAARLFRESIRTGGWRPKLNNPKDAAK